MSDPARITEACEAAAAALEAGDYATAERKALVAKLWLSAMPHGKQGSSEADWDRNAIDSLITQIKQAKAARIGVQRRPILYRRPQE